MKSHAWSVALAATLSITAAGSAQETPQPQAVPPEAARRDARQASAEITLTRVFGFLQLTRAQAGQLAPLLEQAQAALKEVDNQEAAAVARLKPAAEEARRQALAGGNPPAAVEQQLQGVLKEFATRRERARADQIALIRGRLPRILTPQQTANLQAALGAAEQQSEGARAWAQFTSGERGGGPVSAMANRLDGIRNIPADRWPQMRDRMAAGFALGRPAPGVFGAGGPGFRPGGPGGPGGFDGPGGLGGPGGRGGGPGGPGGRGGRPDANDPAVQTRVQQSLAMLERVRSMSAQEWTQVRAGMALQMWSQGMQQRPRGPQDPQEQLSRFIDEYLLDAAAPKVARRLAGMA
jgi:hypothetical protein